MRVIAEVRHQRLIARFIGHGFNAAQHVGKYLVGERGQQHANRAAGGVREHVGRTVGDIAEFIQRHGDFVAQRRRDLIGVPQIAADGHFCDADAIGNIL